MTDSASLKIERASKHICELIKLFGEKRAFSYVLETNTQTGERATFAKKNEAVVAEGALICGDVVHNLRTALDHVFWEIVSPHVPNDAEHRTIQFPFCREGSRLDQTITQRLANRVSPEFVDAIRKLRPYHDAGGNQYLYLVHEFDLLDKHRLLTPIGDYTFLSGSVLRRTGVPDFPFHYAMGFGQNKRDVSWPVVGKIPADTLGSPVPPTTNIFERELDITVDVVFQVRVETNRPTAPVIQTLNKMILATKDAVAVMRAAA